MLTVGDLRFASCNSRWVAVKIKDASYSAKTRLENDPEIRALRAIEDVYKENLQQNGDDIDQRCFVRLVDYFSHSGPNGTHNCIVIELLGPSVATVLRRYEATGQTLRPDTILRTSKRLLDGLKFANQAGFAHGGISPRRLLIACPKLYANPSLKIFPYSTPRLPAAT